MAKWLKAILGVLAAVGLPGCDAIGLADLKPGISTVTEVREKMGPPTGEWRNDDGTTTLEYARGPAGKQNYLMVIGGDGILEEIRQTLTAKYFATIRPGMTPDEVRRILGKPGSTERFPLKQQDAWTWRFEDQYRNDMQFHVYFDHDGKVVGTEQTQEQRG